MFDIKVTKFTGKTRNKNIPNPAGSQLVVVRARRPVYVTHAVEVGAVAGVDNDIIELGGLGLNESRTRS